MPSPSKEHPPFLIADHELIRSVGMARRGEVLLARNLSGTYRAVKIIHRDNFQTDEQFEREFQSIQQFEPVSRTHHGLVAVLHVGRSEVQPGYFYYIMEVADDVESGPRVDPETYKPRTLASEIGLHRRFSLAKCVEIVGALAAALGHLHHQNFIHGNIRPSNIVFVNGAPKLGAVGLVPNTDALDCVIGPWSGFEPFEGPGRPNADIYGLGKVLYQMATGNPLVEFPALPTDLDHRSMSDMLKLNPIILKACALHPRRRYRSAYKMCAALESAQRDASSLISAFLKWLR